jgi:hypothetical protein
MLYVFNDITRFSDFKVSFQKQNSEVLFLDLSKVRSADLAEESKSIVSHHSACAVFLGYLEPGWMIEASNQVIMRSLIRQFPTAMVCNFVESISHSWKNEIDVIYTDAPLNKNGNSSSLNDGCAV